MANDKMRSKRGPGQERVKRMSPTCRADIGDMSATDTNVCRLGGVADRYKSQHCQPSLQVLAKGLIGGNGIHGSQPHDDFVHQQCVLYAIECEFSVARKQFGLCGGGECLAKANAHHRVVLLSTGLSISFPSLTEALTLCFERRLVDLTILFDDIDSVAITIDKGSDLLRALVPAHLGCLAMKSFNEDDGLDDGHGKTFGKCLVVKSLTASLVD